MSGIKEGSVVVLNTGGCKMTVEKIHGTTAKLIWFGGPQGTTLLSSHHNLSDLVLVE